MSSQCIQPHFILIPLMCPGHQIPTTDMARLFARRGVIATIVTTPQNAARFSEIINRDVKSGLPIRILQLRFPSLEFGLPEGCENVDSLPSRDSETSKNFFIAISRWRQPLKQLLEELEPSPSCIISDKHLPWTTDIASELGVPRLVFDGTNCFSFVCSHYIRTSKVHEKVSEFQPFTVPGLPDAIQLTRAQLPVEFNPGAVIVEKVHKEIEAAESKEYGMIVNTFEDLEIEYVKQSRRLKGTKVWCIGPVSLCNKDVFDKSQRGNRITTSADTCIKWLDSWAPSSMIYVCLGTLSCLTTPQSIELGLGLEASNRPFIWVIRSAEGIERWMLESGYEERVKGRGLLIKGWAPQMLILSHRSVGGFLTHCGWNSTLEGICAGLPMVTWPLLAEQFMNEQLIVNVLGVGVRVGSEIALKWGEEDTSGVLVKKEQVKEAIDRLMDGGKEGEERRSKARSLAERANIALEEGGSSQQDIVLLIEDMMQHGNQGIEKKNQC